jgi:hypothetical protein
MTIAKRLSLSLTLFSVAACGAEPTSVRLDDPRAVRSSALDEAPAAPAPGEEAGARAAGGEVAEEPAPTGEYRGHFCGEQLFVVTSGITEADALASCALNAASNPDRSVLCTWEGRVILVDERAPGACDALSGARPGPADESPAGGDRPLCGLFRGGLDEGTHMIASPNPAGSVEDTDEACLAYCDASGPQPGDACARGGAVIGLYDGAAPAGLE